MTAAASGISTTKQSTLPVLDLRQREIYKMMVVSGLTTSTIVEKLSVRYGLAESTIRGDITEVYKHIKHYYETEQLPNMAADHTSKYFKIYEEALAAGDKSNALKALNAAERLAGFHKHQTNIQVNNNNLSLLDNITPEQLTEMLNALTKKDDDVKDI